jgi:DNA primase
MAKHIPEYFLRDLLARIDIVDVVKARVPIKKRGANYLGICPFHQEKSPSFTVSQPKQFYHCFGCGKHGNAFGFLMDYEHMGFVEAVEELAKTLGLDVPYEGGKDTAPKEKLDDLYDLMKQAAALFAKNLREHPEKALAVNYLKQRGVTGKSAKEFSLGFAPEAWDNLLKHLKISEIDDKALLKTGLFVSQDQGRMYDRFRRRIMFPIHDLRGRVIAFGGRVIDQGEPKYLNSPETPIFHKGRTLYGLYEAKQNLKHLPQIMIVEGYMDVLMLAQAGIQYAVATLGTATTEEYIRLLLKETQELVFCFDGDRAGRDAAWRALRTCLPFLTGSANMRFLFLPEGEDPDSLVQKVGEAQFEELIKTAPALGEFLLSECAKKFDLRSIGGKSQYLSELKPYFDKIPQGAYRLMLEESLARRLGLVSEQLTALWQSGEIPTTKKAVPRVPKSLDMIERALALLLVYPHLAQKFTLPVLTDDNTTLLSDIWQFCAQQNPAHFGAILAHFQEANFYETLLELGTHPYTEMIQDPIGEFNDIAVKLAALKEASHLEYLLMKSRQGELSVAEKAELRDLLGTRAGGNL